MSYITVRIRKSAQAPADNYCFEDGSSVADIMERLDMRFDKFDVYRDDELLDSDEILSDGDELVITARKLSSGC